MGTATGARSAAQSPAATVPFRWRGALGTRLQATLRASCTSPWLLTAPLGAGPGDEVLLLPGRAGRGWSTASGLGSSGDSSLLLTTVWPERSRLSGSQNLLDHSLAQFITPNRAVIHAGRLIILEFTLPSVDNLWRRG